MLVHMQSYHVPFGLDFTLVQNILPTLSSYKVQSNSTLSMSRISTAGNEFSPYTSTSSRSEDDSFVAKSGSDPDHHGRIISVVATFSIFAFIIFVAWLSRRWEREQQQHESSASPNDVRDNSSTLTKQSPTERKELIERVLKVTVCIWHTFLDVNRYICSFLCSHSLLLLFLRPDLLGLRCTPQATEAILIAVTLRQKTLSVLMKMIQLSSIAAMIVLILNANVRSV